MYSNEDFYLLIGKITIYFSTLDFLTSQLIYQTVKKDIIHKLQDNSTLGQKLRFLKELEKESYFSAEVYNEIQKVIDSVIKVSDERNRYIHDMWVFDQTDVSKGMIKRFKLKGTKDLVTKLEQPVSISISDMQAFEEKLLSSESAICDLAKKYNFGNQQST